MMLTPDIPVDRIGAGGVTSSLLLADIAKARQANADRIMGTLRAQTMHGAEELLEAERVRIVGLNATD